MTLYEFPVTFYHVFTLLHSCCEKNCLVCTMKFPQRKRSRFKVMNGHLVLITVLHLKNLDSILHSQVPHVNLIPGHISHPWMLARKQTYTINFPSFSPCAYSCLHLFTPLPLLCQRQNYTAHTSSTKKSGKKEATKLSKFMSGRY